ncbi:hippurate hydrolase [Variovorax sp. OV329]|nr:hippurate hydrolase [Variovorax sp. OV329]
MHDRHTQVMRELGRRADDIRAWRRGIHHYPELAFDEHKTSALVAQLLEQWGYEVHRGLAATGVVGVLRRGTGPRRLGLRADMDALPIQELVGRPYGSCRPGLMHACGHDGHTAMLLGAAHFLAEQGEFDGTLHLIFQPGEEGAGGAKRMMDEGLFERFPCDSIFAMHNAPLHRQGELQFREGPTMASADYATVTLHGVGGHGGMPHLATDPLVAAAALVTALQTVVSRNCDPQIASTVTVATLHAGDSNIVIPNQAVMQLSVRALDQAQRDLMVRRVEELAMAQARSFGVRAEIEWRQGYPVLVNWPEPTRLAYQSALARFGAERCVPQTPAVTASEDFAFMLEKVPGAYFFIGNGDAPGSCVVHHPGYDFNDDNLVIGAAMWVGLAEDFLVRDTQAQG